MDQPRVRVVVEPANRNRALNPKRKTRLLRFAEDAAFFVVALMVGWYAHKLISPYLVKQPDPTPASPREFYNQRRLLPSQTYRIYNHTFRVVHVRSELPVSIDFGDCHASYTLDWTCQGDPLDIVIRDDRAVTPYTAPTGNDVSVEAREY